MTSSPPRHIAVIDIGKTNAKLVLFDARTQTQIAVRSTPNTVIAAEPYPHADVERLWRFILESLSRFGAGHGVDGISITTHGATAALVDGHDLVLPVLDYEHAGPDGLGPAYDAVRPDFTESLSPRLPGGLNLGAQLFWQARTFPDAFARAKAILTYPQYWAWRLTGRMASEVTSLGCHTDLWAPARKDFSSLVARMAWRDLFPPVTPAASVLGGLLPALAAQTGLSAGLPVTCGIHDSNASLLPHLEDGAGPSTIISSGTWTIAMTMGGSTSGLDPDRDSLANVDAFGRPVPTARFMGGREFDLLVPQVAEPTPEDVAGVIAADIQALPSFVPGVGPFGDRQPGWTQDPNGLDAGMRTAAASLYLALVAAESLTLCGLGRRIVLEGPLARNGLFASALARLTGAPVHASGDGTGTSLGASLLFGGHAENSGPGAPVAPLSVDGFDAYAARWRQRAGQ